MTMLLIVEIFSGLCFEAHRKVQLVQRTWHLLR